MRLRDFNDDTWGFALLTELERELLAGLASAADTLGCKKAEHRLYQPPIDNPSEEETSFLDDWEDFVTTGFRQEFADALAVVEADLQNCVPLDGNSDDIPDDEGEHGDKAYFSLQIPKAHAESWYGALNQARLVLATRFDLFDSNGDETVAISWEGERPTVMVDDSSQNPHPVETRINAFLRNQAYSFIQEWLIAQVLSAEL